MTIRSKILDVKKRLLDEFITEDHTFSSGVQELALGGINDGPHSDKLREYMTMFAEDEKQLLRLMAEDGTHVDPDMNRARSYLLADGTCGTETATNFGNNTTLVLDQ